VLLSQALVSLQCPAPVCSLDVGTNGAYVVAGCMGGIVCVHALPPWSLLAATQGVVLQTGSGGRASVPSSSYSNMEERNIAKDFAGEASSLVKVRRCVLWALAPALVTCVSRRWLTLAASVAPCVARLQGLFSGLFGKKT
jgi:hypothetical protein